jgi:hypothetical protein
MKEETIAAISNILQSIKHQGLRSGQGVGSVDAGTLNSVSLSQIDTQVLFRPEGLKRILTNPECGILPLCVERTLDRALTERSTFSLEEAQARMQSSALFIMATQNIEDNLDNDPEQLSQNMQIYGSSEVSYKPGMSILPDQLECVLAPAHLVKFFKEAGFERVWSTPMTTMPVDQLALDMSLVDSQCYSGQLVQVPNYGDALKTIFSEARRMQIFLHVTRLPCDFDYSLAPAVTPKSILENKHFKLHPKGNGATYFKNYSSSVERDTDKAILSQEGFFSIKEATTKNGQKLSLIATVKLT